MKFNPAKLAILSFMTLVLVGTLLIMLPKATVSHEPIRVVDALFTATSAVCVTGLSVLDTGSSFSLLGQVIILFLIQVGGIGIVTIATFLAILFGKGMAFRERIVMREMTNSDKISLITSTLKTIVLTMVCVEAIGALALMTAWAGEGWSLARLVYVSVFHSVSAFCNAGFTLFPDSLMSYRSNTSVILVISFLIILGGLGFRVIADIIQAPLRRLHNSARIPIMVQSRLVLIVSAILVFVGAAGYLLLESSHSGASFKENLLFAFFTSVTSRTAGFNCVDTGGLSIQYSMIIIILMFIGASPGSTGGGIKTTTLAVLVMSIISIIIGKKRIVIFRRNIPFMMLNRALIVFTISSFLLVFAVFLLLVFENHDPVDLLFEAVSAFGTVGLSRGITEHLSNAGKLILILCMFVGRVGILTVTFATVSGREERVRIEYPSENIMVG
jgi:trk system potassium uptake protein TrkH